MTCTCRCLIDVLVRMTPGISSSRYLPRLAQMMIDQSRKKLLADFEQWAAVMVRQRQATEASSAAAAGGGPGIGGAGGGLGSQLGSPQSARGSRPGSVRMAQHPALTTQSPFRRPARTVPQWRALADMTRCVRLPMSSRRRRGARQGVSEVGDRGILRLGGRAGLA